MRYQAKASGPLLDRIDLHIDVPQVPFDELSGERVRESSEAIRKRVEFARTIQSNRFKAIKNIHCNAHMGPKEIATFCRLSTPDSSFLAMAIKKFGLSVRAYHKILKVARTIADLEGSGAINRRHIAEAIQYRVSKGVPDDFL